MFIKQCRDKGITDELIIYAMQLAVDNKKKTIAYIKGVLNNWEKADITSVLEAQQATEEFKKQKNKVNQSNNNKTKNYKNYPQRKYENVDKLYANNKEKATEG